MAKRKRDSLEPSSPSKRRAVALQIVTGSYEGVLHGFYAEIDFPIEQSEDKNEQSQAVFTDNFLEATHNSAIRCLAISPSSTDGVEVPQSSHSKRLLATGGTDARIIVYQLSADKRVVQESRRKSKRPIKTNKLMNHQLGSLLHHASTITSLSFPSRSKLLSASLDSTIAVTRMKDLTVISSLKAPIPKPVGRPSGDTAGPGEVPAGVNEMALHPSTKLCISIGIGEKCMRLWNLVTGKRAAVLTFDKETLAAAGEMKVRGGEGRRVAWNITGNEFVIAFERAVVVYSIDCHVKLVVQIKGTKVCQVKYLPGIQRVAAKTDGQKRGKNVLLVSTEDGRILFYDTDSNHNVNEPESSKLANGDIEAKGSTTGHHLMAQIGTASRGSRIKDFEVIPIMSSNEKATAANGDHSLKEAEEDLVDEDDDDDHISSYAIITGSSDGTVQIWHLDPEELYGDSSDGTLGKHPLKRVKEGHLGASRDTSQTTGNVMQVGTLLGKSETGKRITCLGAFLIDGTLDEDKDDDAWGGLSEEDSNSEENDDDDEEDDSDDD